jgi:hypothetical protein
LQFGVIADLSSVVEDSTARLDQMSHQEIAETFVRMGAITSSVTPGFKGKPECKNTCAPGSSYTHALTQ